MQERGENYKIEHIADLADETEFSFYQQGEYVDMCIGPHLTYTKALKAFKITQQSGAYWKNDKGKQDADPHQRRRLHNQEELEAWEKEQQEAREPRPPQDRQGDAAVHDRRPGRPRPADVFAQRLHRLAGARELY